MLMIIEYQSINHNSTPYHSKGRLFAAMSCPAGVLEMLVVSLILKISHMAIVANNILCKYHSQYACVDLLLATIFG